VTSQFKAFGSLFELQEPDTSVEFGAAILNEVQFQSAGSCVFFSSLYFLQYAKVFKWPPPPFEGVLDPLFLGSMPQCHAGL
jgi:hypothetical protein